MGMGLTSEAIKSIDTAIATDSSYAAAIEYRASIIQEKGNN